jgi:uncharacterized caspase-like protein
LHFSKCQFGILLLCLAGSALAAERQLQIAPKMLAPGGEKRIALVIGNSAYKSSPLRNPVNDARAIARALADTGFKVLVIEDATQTTMRRAIRAFGDQLAIGGVGVFYYAGHGMQVRGRNYLIPVNADIEREDEVEDQAVDANVVLAKMDSAKNSLNLMILDACRNNPFMRAFRSSAQGLAQMDAPSGTLVAFATAPGSVAADGEGANGVYTKHLLANISKPGLPVEQLFKQVRIGVTRETRDRQVPWESSSLKGDFFFVAPVLSSSAEAQRQQTDNAVAEAVRREQEKLALERAAMQRQMEQLVADLLAKQRAALEEEMRKRGETPPKPAIAALSVVPTPSEPPKMAGLPKPAATPASAPGASAGVQVASIAPTLSIGTGIDNPRFPKVGDNWEYRYTDTTTRLSSVASFEVTAVSKQGIVDSGGFAEAKPLERAHSAAANMNNPRYWDFSPYLLSFGAPGVGSSWRNIPYQTSSSCNMAGTPCRYDGKVVGMEKVTTPAGRFNALKVVIDFNATFYSNQVWRQATYWYSEEAKRVVKSSVRTRSGNSMSPDYDLELVSYKLN